MQITNCGQGVHAREVTGVDKLKSLLPVDWYAFTNLDVVLSPGETREIDVVIIADDRIFVVDLKDWHGRIESDRGDWVQNGKRRVASPVAKIGKNARDVSILLKGDLNRHAKGHKLIPPRVLGVVVVTTGADLTGIASTEASLVYRIDDFVKILATPTLRDAAFNKANAVFAHEPLTSPKWKHRLSKFFNAPTGPVRPGQRNYGGFIAESDAPTFEHTAGVFREFNAAEARPPHGTGTVRLWDFTKADTRFQTQEGRLEIAGRERSVAQFLSERSEACERLLLQPRAEDHERGVSYWEVFERRRRLQRLGDFALSAKSLSADEKVELARQVVAAAGELHRVDTAHLDLGAHSVWLESPSTVKLSHLMAARIPEVKSLGDARYQFLSSADLPEGKSPSDAKLRDVFLIGVCVHQMVFSALPEGSDPDTVWSERIDAESKFVALHAWFRRALSRDPARRYGTAIEALVAFNTATASRPTRQEVLEGLENFGRVFQSQKQFARAYPEQKSLLESLKLDVWESDHEENSTIVKMWKSSAWGDPVREGPRILEFLYYAEDLRLSPPTDCARVLGVHWLSDAIGLVLERVSGTALSQSMECFTTAPDAARFLLRFCGALEALHNRGLAHGDVKPDNIIVSSELAPVLIDLVDFAAAGDGELITNAYAPASGGRQERDRYAAGKVAEEMLARFKSDAGVSAILEAIELCRENEPQNATLAPLVEALDVFLTPSPVEPRISIEVMLRAGEAGPIISDEGRYYVRRRNAQCFVVRGAMEELEIDCDIRGEAVGAARKRIDQKFINARHEFYSFAGDIAVRASATQDLTPLRALLGAAEFRAALVDVGGEIATEGEEDAPDDVLSDQSSDDLADAIGVEAPSVGGVDVKLLWRTLMDVESTLTTEGVTQGDSRFDVKLKRHVAPFELATGVFEFDRKRDFVGVERFDEKRNEWRRVGELDLMRSKPDLAVINSDLPDNFQLFYVDQRIRFTSHFEIESRRRRQSAISRLLDGESRIGELASIFADPNRTPRTIDVPTPEDLKGRYGLNEVQVEAFATLIRTRPLGLLQGPPGTGKTRFIAALAHYALEHGLAANVLLASQSHEAVNTAAEALLQLYRVEDKAPSLLRVGNETVVSDRLAAFHPERVEQGLKDKFRAELSRRMAIAANTLGIPDSLGAELYDLETGARPIIERLAQMTEEDRAGARGVRVAETAKALVERLGVEWRFDSANVDAADRAIDDIAEQLRTRAAKTRVSADRVRRYQQVAALGRDFMASASGPQRSFEPFLAGTRRVVAGTCVGLGRPSLGLTSTAFDLVIVDEAARCTASELAVPMQAARWVVLVGDQAQLEPMHPPSVVSTVSRETGIPKREVSRSDFERVFAMKYGQLAGRTLTTQYRMLPPIGRIVSNAFYDKALEHGRPTAEVDPAILPPELATAVTWIGTDDLGEQAQQRRDPSGTSLSNLAEAQLIISLLERWQKNERFVQWLSAPRASEAIGVICTYASQRDLLRRRLHGAGLKSELARAIKIDTVDAYQGKENAIVLLSLVRNNWEGPIENGAATIAEGFMARPHRINVALSRAMERLVILGSHARWRAASPLGWVRAEFDMEVAGGHAALMKASELLESPKDGAKKRRRGKK